MNRLQKKCVIVSSSLHVLLLLVLLFGAALMPDPDDQSNFKPITVYSSEMVSDAMTSGGGNPAPAVALTPPAVTPPKAATPEPPQPKPAVQPVQPPAPKPEPKPERVETPKPHAREEVPETRPEPPKKSQDSPDWFDRIFKSKPKTVTKEEATPAPPEKHKIVIDHNSLKQVTRKSNEKPAEHSDDRAERAARAERHRAAQQFASSLRSISKNLSSSTVVSMPSGGGSGPASVNYNDLIASKYYNAWVVPPGLDSGATVKVSVTISRDGSVVSSRIIKSSGDRLLDESIRGALNSVQFIEAFPDSFRESQRTVTINFNPQIKQQTG